MSNWVKKFWSALSGRDSWKKTFELACSSFQEGNHAAAQTYFEEALALAEKEPDKSRSFTTLVCMGACLRATDQFSQGETLLRRALDLSPADCPADDLAYVRRELGICLYEQSRAPESEPFLSEALTFYSKCAQQDSDEAADCCFFLARSLILQCKFEQALEPLKRSLQIYRRNEELHLAEIADSYHCQAVVMNRLEQYSGAEGLLIDAVKMHEKLFGKESVEVARCQTELATAILSQGRYDEAERILTPVMQSLAGLPAQHSLDLADCISALGACCRFQKRPDEAVIHYETALALYRKEHGDEHPDVGAVLTLLAVCYTEQNKFERAEPYFRQALALSEKETEPDPVILGDNYYNVAKCCVLQKRYGEAIPFYEKLAEILTRLAPEDQSAIASILSELGYCYQLQSQLHEAKSAYHRALKLYETANSSDDEIADSLIGLANCYLESGELSKARPLYERVLQSKQFKFDPQDQDLATRIEELLKEMEHAPV